MGKNRVDRAGRISQMLRIVGEQPGITTRQLARQMGMAYSPHFRGIVWQLWQDKKLHGQGYTRANGFVEFRWQLR